MKQYLLKTIYIVFLSGLSITAFSQSSGETKKWYFGNHAGLDFTTTPPTALTNGSMSAVYSCASVADGSGNLLFYTDGATVWDQTHNIMANGTGLFGGGNSWSSQGSIILKQPGSSTLYYIITGPNCWNCTTGINYSIVDMSLASGNGSVTTKNANLYTGYTAGRITATRHCNGVDIWIVGREAYYTSSSSSGTYTPNFRAYLLTSAGINTTAVVSSAATYSWNTSWSWNDWGCMKISPNGKKLGLANYNNWSNWTSNYNSFELWDFDNTTGAVTNSLGLVTNSTSSTNWWGGWGCEFSPDGTKFYGSILASTTTSGTIYQFDICAGSATAIAASQYSFSTPYYSGALQLAPDGKIYNAVWSYASLGIIGNPNGTGSACNYTSAAISLSPKTSYYSLPNFMGSHFVGRPPPTPFTYTASNSFGCQTASFTSAYAPSITVVGCSATGYSLTNMLWNFGDPNSGSNNTSTSQNPSHAFTTLGTYTVQLILYYSCGGGTDTLKQQVIINQPCISVSSTSITCSHLGSATVQATGGVGPFSYTWMPTAQASSVAVGLSPGTYTLTVYDFGTNFTYTATTQFTSLIPLTGNFNYASSITCYGASTGTANFTNLAGGSGSENYVWTNGTTTYTTPMATMLSAGLWSATCTDALTGCQMSQLFLISQPPAMALNLSSNTPTACAGTTVSLSGINSGGTPGYTYQWLGGPATDTRIVSQALAGTYIYTLNSKDSYSCSINNTISVDFVPNPTLSVSHVSICPLQVGTLVVSGATTYTWTGGLNGNTYTANPLSTTLYSLVGSALSCTTAASASIVLKPLPVPLISSNGPVCNGQSLNFYAAGGASYYWTGPLSFTSGLVFPSIYPANPNHSGTYNMTVTAANSCTASTSINVTVNPTPTVSATGNTVCVNQFLTLSANSLPGSTFQWFGPNNIFAFGQNPNLSYQPVSSSGIYTVVATSAVGCTNSAVANVTITALPMPFFSSNSPQCFGSTLNFTGGGGGAYSWSGPNGFASAQQNPQISNVTVPSTGNYTLTVTIGPCVNSIFHSVIINPLPSFTLSTNSPTCETKDLVLKGGYVSNALSYHWQGPGFSNGYQNTVRPTSSLGYSGVYTLTVIDSNYCQNAFTTSVTIMPNPVMTVSGAKVCLNQPAVLSASGAATYFWDGPNYYQSNQQYALIPSATSSVITIYTVVGTAANTCTSVVTTTLETMSLPSPWLTVWPKNKVCLKSPLILEGFGGYAYEWRGPGNYYFAGKVLSLTPTSMAYAGDYTVTVTDTKGCSSFSTTNISFDALPDGYLKGSKEQGCTPFCSDFNFFTSSNSSKQLTTNWEINNKLLAGKSFSYCFTTPGDYLITGNLLDTTNFCANTVTLMVNAYPLPKADFDFTPAKPVESMDEVNFINTSSGDELHGWKWFFATNENHLESRENASYTFKDAGIYPVAMYVSNKWGCIDTVVKAIEIEPDFHVYVPNAFTPNEDNNNEVFIPVCRGIKFYSFSVFNRWGTELFKTSDMSLGWDGTYGGKICKEDVYSWKLVVTNVSGDQKTYTGHVTLYR